MQNGSRLDGTRLCCELNKACGKFISNIYDQLLLLLFLVVVVAVVAALYF